MMPGDKKQQASLGRLLFTAFVVVVSVISAFSLANYMRRGAEPGVIVTIADLPKEVRLVHHPEEALEAERLGKIAMSHYATPDAEHNGGPVYGAYGYQIVAIEYEIPLSSIGTRLVGSNEPGRLLSLPEFAALAKTVPYDHFHIGISQHPNHALHEYDSNWDERLIIHFMLLPHDVEEAIGLYCG